MDFIFDMKDQANLSQTLTWFLSKKSLHLDNEGDWVVDMVAKTITHSYRSLQKSHLEVELAYIDIDLIGQYSLSGDADYLQPVRDLQTFITSDLQEHVVDFLVHGSLATGDYVKGWSDFDTFVIIKSDTISDFVKLIEFRKKIIEAQDYLLDLDPLQHHGFIYCTEYDLEQYFSHCMPIAVLRESKSLLKSSTLAVQYNRSQDSPKKLFESKLNMFKQAYENGTLIHHQYEGKYLQEDFADIDTMYQMKYFLAVLMSLPILYLDALDTSCYKKHSFDLVKRDFELEWEIMDKASNIRSRWELNEVHPFVGNEIPVWLQRELGGSYFKRAYLLAKLMGEALETSTK